MRANKDNTCTICAHKQKIKKNLRSDERFVEIYSKTIWLKFKI